MKEFGQLARSLSGNHGDHLGHPNVADDRMPSIGQVLGIDPGFIVLFLVKSLSLMWTRMQTLEATSIRSRRGGVLVHAFHAAYL